MCARTNSEVLISVTTEEVIVKSTLADAERPALVPDLKAPVGDTTKEEQLAASKKLVGTVPVSYTHLYSIQYYYFERCNLHV